MTHLLGLSSRCLVTTVWKQSKMLIPRPLELSGFEKIQGSNPVLPNNLTQFRKCQLKYKATFFFFYLDVKFMNTFQKIPEYFKANCKISPHVSNTFKIDHRRDIASRDFYMRYIVNVDNRSSRSTINDVRCSSISSASSRNSGREQHI